MTIVRVASVRKNETTEKVAFQIGGESVHSISIGQVADCRKVVREDDIFREILV